MAVTGNFFTIEGLEDVYMSGEAELYDLLGTESQAEYREALLVATIVKLNTLIDIFKSAEDGLLKKLNAKSLSELEERLHNFYSKSGYHRFIDKSAMDTIKANYEAATDTEKAAIREQYINLLNNLLVEAIQTVPHDKRFQTDMKGAVLTEVGRLLKKYGFDGQIASTGQGMGGITITSKLIHWDTNGDLSFFPELATSIVKARLDRMITLASNQALLKEKIKSKQDREQFKRITSLQTNSTVSKNKASINIGFTIGELTKGKTGTDIESMSKKELRAINNEIVHNLILQLSPEFRETAKKVIQSMLIQNDKMFFVGDSFSTLRGVLGEIGSMHAISYLLGLNKPNDQIITWVATNLTGGKQLSVDIILRDLAHITVKRDSKVADFGIQIKNVQANRVDFVDTSLDLILQKLNIDAKSLENVLFSDNFNIAYTYNLNTDQFVPLGTWPASLYNIENFLNIETLIDGLVKDIQSFFNMYAPELLYMGFSDDFINSVATLSNELSSLSGNVLYIVRDTPFFASEMLIKIRDNLLDTTEKIKGQAFKIRFSINELKTDQNGFNIITYLNQQGTKNAQSIRKHSVTLTSSYLFSK